VFLSPVVEHLYDKRKKKGKIQKTKNNAAYIKIFVGILIDKADNLKYYML